MIVKVIAVITLVFILTSCKSDNFYDVTKKINTPHRIKINKPFSFNVVLVNNTVKEVKLTFDKELTKSLYFNPRWYCGKKWVLDRTPNSKSQTHNYYSIQLQPKDSISFRLNALLKSYANNDSLVFVVEGYEKNFKLANPRCSDFKMRLEATWLPGDGPLFDSMEGYDFRKDIKID